MLLLASGVAVLRIPLELPACLYCLCCGCIWLRVSPSTWLVMYLGVASQRGLQAALPSHASEVSQGLQARIPNTGAGLLQIVSWRETEEED